MKVQVEFEFPVAILSDSEAREFFESQLRALVDWMRHKHGRDYDQYPYVSYQRSLDWHLQE